MPALGKIVISIAPVMNKDEQGGFENEPMICLVGGFNPFGWWFQPI